MLQAAARSADEIEGPGPARVRCTSPRCALRVLTVVPLRLEDAVGLALVGHFFDGFAVDRLASHVQ